MMAKTEQCYSDSCIGSRNVRVVLIAGVRPQFIKIAALQQAIHHFNQTSTILIEPLYINTSQHYDEELSTSIIRELHIHFDFNLTHSSRTPIHILANMITGTYELLNQMRPKPKWVIVIGDANSALAGAIAAADKGYPVVHIEAGVRSGQLDSPEEAHRRIISHLSTVHFCTSQSGIANLAAENIRERVFWTGDLSYDFFMEYSKRQPCGLQNFRPGEYVLVTLHKSTNMDSDIAIRNLVNALERHPRRALFVTHPRCRRRLMEFGLLGAEQISFVDSLPYGNMISAIKGCAFLITDSGGLQREAYYLQKHCLIRRDSPGWVPLVGEGIHQIIGSETQSIMEGLQSMERMVASEEYGHTDEFVRIGATEYALNLLLELSP